MVGYEVKTTAYHADQVSDDGSDDGSDDLSEVPDEAYADVSDDVQGWDMR